MNLLGGSYLRYKSQHRRKHGADMHQLPDLARLVQLARVAKSKVVRSAHRRVRSSNETSAVNLPTARSACGLQAPDFRGEIATELVRRLPRAIEPSA